MKMKYHAIVFGLLSFAVPLTAQPADAPVATNSYSANVSTVQDAQSQALTQAQQMLAQGEGVRDRGALESAIKEMKLAQAALDAAKNSPDKLPAAIAAEQAAYQALLKVTPREYRVTQSRNGHQQGGSSAGQANQSELNQLDLQSQENRYETESQASTPQNAQQREQSQTVDRLKQLAQRQQDLNDRLRDLQTQLQAARTDEERADLQRQLKRLQEEQRQMLANVDEMRQQLAQSPNASLQAETQRQLEQTRNDMERAAQQMEQQSASQALAAGTRAQETMQNLQNDLQQQTSSRFSQQMRQMRNQARDMTQREDEIARELDSLNNGEHQALDNSADRQRIVQQLEQQQTALTNLLAQMRDVTEQSETTEPLLSKQLYDTYRSADQAHTDNLLQMGSQLTDRGFLPQASQVERIASTNLTALARGIDRAADSVLGSETDALKYAQRELDDLTRQVENELPGAGTNATVGAFAAGTTNGGAYQSNSLARAAGNIARDGSTNLTAAARNGSRGQQAAGNNAGQTSPENQPAGQEQGQQQANGGNGDRNGNQQQANNTPNGNRGQRPDGNNAGQASAANQQAGQEQANGGNGSRGGNRGNNQQANNARGGKAQPGAQARAGGNTGGGDRLRQLAVQLGTAAGAGGPITGSDYVDWSGRLQDVEQAVNQEDLRNQLATVRERVAALRADYRQRGRRPDANIVREQIVLPLTQVRAWLQDELARQEKSDSLVPLDRDPVPDNYADLVRQYYEKLGSAQ